jgi:hypothetical protein
MDHAVSQCGRSSITRITPDICGPGFQWRSTGGAWPASEEEETSFRNVRFIGNLTGGLAGSYDGRAILFDSTS